MTFAEQVAGALVMGPMTKGSNLPYRRLCVELGARVTVSEMAVARRLRQKRRPEFALIRRAPEERCFGVQLAGNKPDEMAWAAGLVEERGADFVDLNLGCPIDRFTRIGLGAALGRQPNRVRRLVEAMKRGVSRVPVTVKIRLGWDDGDRNYLDVVRAAVDGGADGIAVHGRTRDARYRSKADWEAIAEVAAAVSVPVLGNGDLLFGHEAGPAIARSGCAAVMTARGALIRPWIFREHLEGYRPVEPEERLAVYRRYVALALEHWGDHERGRSQVRMFLVWHLGFWCRDAPRRPDGSWPGMQERESRDLSSLPPLESLLAREDEAAHAWLADRLLAGAAVDPAEAPPAEGTRPPEDRLAAVEG
ncbi:MAG: dus 1 [Acidobacteria bacterium]|nr:dus 1 [Acidobacteriota bacterium]